MSIVNCQLSTVILGVDPGTAITGYGIIRKEHDGSLISVRFGCIKTKKELRDAERLNQLRYDLIKIIQENNPDTAAVEKLFFTTNAKTAISVSHARGVCVEALFSAGLQIAEFTPLQVKQAVTGYGKAEKTQVQKMVQILLRLKELPKPDDAADALAVAICAAHTGIRY